MTLRASPRSRPPELLSAAEGDFRLALMSAKIENGEVALVYLVTFPNGKGYVGMTTVSLAERIIQHRWDAKNSKRAICRALLRYGGSAVWEEVITGLTREEAYAEESRLIHLLRTASPNGYNLTLGGEGYRKVDKDRDDRLELAIGSVSAGVSCEEAARVHQVPASSLLVLCRRRGLQVRAPNRDRYVGSAFMEQAIQMLRDGATARTAAAKHGVGRAPLIAAARAAGLLIPEKGGAKSKRPDYQALVTEALRLVSVGLSAYAAARLAGVSKQTVLRAMHKKAIAH